MTQTLIGIALLAIVPLASNTWIDWWLTPDQQGERLMRRQEYELAAEAYTDPYRQGVAWFRAGEFERAAQSFARVSTAEAKYNLGNCWVMLGKYDKAVDDYEQSLRLRPDWKEAQENRDLAAARAKLVEQKGGDMGDQQIGADEVVFDKDAKKGGQETEVAGSEAMSDAAIQAIWLRQVQTKPADFLKAKFAFQNAQSNEGGEE
ncbi:tetratricopeptide repeat protein [Roseiconus nitratireducens]|uniref:Tetratricopeptide repeat protein n=1 Tax=Roseiconus nitratireducens TaxID=2605748 RepID=A0A5M6DII7_9BACT|nr:tetratricopeptide repeat protein [Roseiconus nitratireducens]KAA5547283.1 tetratricopeptide repeat protein [Roseiconus nitratireducens]